MVPRQFLDFVPNAIIADNEEPLNSLSDERTRRDSSGSPVSNKMEINRSEELCEAPDSSKRSRSGKSDTQGNWAATKVPKIEEISKPVEQSMEATMRKARVSVRARSEAPMVSLTKKLRLFIKILKIK